MKVTTDFQRADQVLQQVAVRAKDPEPARRKVPSLARAGRGSLFEQARRRQFIRRDGSTSAWQEPAHLQGRPTPERVRRSEEIMFDAVTGRGPGTVTRFAGKTVLLGADDNVIRILAAAAGNGIVSKEPYLPFVTGRFTDRTTPARSRFSKPSLWRPRGPRVRRPQRAGFVPRFFDPRAARHAAWWLLGLSLDVWLSYEQIRAGLVTPPKNINAWTPGVLSRIADVYGRYIVTGRVA